MNKKLIFSWGHIAAALGIVLFSIVAFLGLSYYTYGQFDLSLLIVCVIDLLLLVCFIGAQQMKIWDGDFKKYIIVERFLLFLIAPIILFIAAIPVNHFIGLYQHKDSFVEQFNTAVDTSKGLFDDYEQYARQRVANLDNMEVNGLSKTIQKKALSLQLLSKNYDNVREDALKWINETAQTLSIYNVFLLGNMNEIEKAIKGWNEQLFAFSKHKLSTEPVQTKGFETYSSHATTAVEMLNKLKLEYHQLQPFNLNTIWFMLLITICLMIPWWTQKRNTKSFHKLFSKEKERGETLQEYEYEREDNELNFKP